MDIAPELILAGSVILLLGFVFGFLLAHLRSQKKIIRLSMQNSALTIKLATEEKMLQQANQLFETQKQQMSERFQALSSKILKQNSQDFLKLAKQNLSHYQQLAKHELDKKENSINGIIQPIRETMEKTQQQLREI
ncbi:MAG TPA: hypothetical protein ENJ28_09165, partial [Gammaproteobacteria bacterium]|nr:hypothetical protein [Gammaproteobacteria bacterium]